MKFRWVLFGALEITRTIDDITRAIAQGFDDFEDIDRVIFEVRVLNDDILATSVLESSLQGCAFTAIDVVLDDFDIVQVSEFVSDSPVVSVLPSLTMMICFEIGKRLTR